MMLCVVKLKCRVCVIIVIALLDSARPIKLNLLHDVRQTLARHPEHDFIYYRLRRSRVVANAFRVTMFNCHGARGSTYA